MRAERGRQPWHPVPYEDGDIAALKALASGTANEGQQKRALEWILLDACAIRDVSFRPGADGDRTTAFAEGRRFVGLQIAKLMNFRTPGPKPVMTGPHAVPIGPPPEA